MLTYLAYARRGQNAWWRYLLGMVLGSVVGLAAISGLGVALVFAHVLSLEALKDVQHPSNPVVFFAGNGIAFAILLAAFAAMIRLLHGKTPLDIIGAWRWPRFAAGLGLWTACLIALTIVDLIRRPSGFHWSANDQTAGLVIAALFGLGVQTFTEEFVFRGYLTQGLLLATKRPIVAAVISGIIFGLLHIPNGKPEWANATLFGIVTALIAIRTGGIAFTFGMHLINNLFGAIFVVSSSDVFHGAPGLFTQTTPDLMWWDLALGVAALALPVWLVMTRIPEEKPAEPEAAFL
jgi:membrane protease YdiL (CAAX protease family)